MPSQPGVITGAGAGVGAAHLGGQGLDAAPLAAMLQAQTMHHAQMQQAHILQTLIASGLAMAPADPQRQQETAAQQLAVLAQLGTGSPLGLFPGAAMQVPHSAALPDTSAGLGALTTVSAPGDTTTAPASGGLVGGAGQGAGTTEGRDTGGAQAMAHGGAGGAGKAAEPVVAERTGQMPATGLAKRVIAGAGIAGVVGDGERTRDASGWGPDQEAVTNGESKEPAEAVMTGGDWAVASGTAWMSGGPAGNGSSIGGVRASGLGVASASDGGPTWGDGGGARDRELAVVEGGATIAVTAGVPGATTRMDSVARAEASRGREESVAGERAVD